jgi:multiple sugar transport system permease protein
VLPLITPAIVVAVAFRLILSFQNFDTAYALNAGGPGNASELLTLYLYKLEFVLFRSSYGAALAVAILALIILLGQVMSRINLDTESSSE